MATTLERAALTAAYAVIAQAIAAIVVLVPLILPEVQSYGIDPVYFGILFLAAMEMGFLCLPKLNHPCAINWFFCQHLVDRGTVRAANAVQIMLRPGAR